MAFVDKNYLIQARIAPVGTHVVFEIGTVFRKDEENYWRELKDGDGSWCTDYGLMRLKQAANDTNMAWEEF